MYSASAHQRPWRAHGLRFDMEGLTVSGCPAACRYTHRGVATARRPKGRTGRTVPFRPSSTPTRTFHGTALSLITRARSCDCQPRLKPACVPRKDGDRSKWSALGAGRCGRALSQDAAGTATVAQGDDPRRQLRSQERTNPPGASDPRPRPRVGVLRRGRPTRRGISAAFLLRPALPARRSSALCRAALSRAPNRVRHRPPLP